MTLDDYRDGQQGECIQESLDKMDRISVNLPQDTPKRRASKFDG